MTNTSAERRPRLAATPAARRLSPHAQGDQAGNEPLPNSEQLTAKRPDTTANLPDTTLTDEEIRNLLRPIPPRGVIKIVWAYRSEPDHRKEWWGYVYEPRGKGGKAKWEVEYRLVDEDGDVAAAEGVLPPPDDIAVYSLAQLPEMPHLQPAKLREPKPRGKKHGHQQDGGRANAATTRQPNEGAAQAAGRDMTPPRVASMETTETLSDDRGRQQFRTWQQATRGHNDDERLPTQQRTPQMNHGRDPTQEQPQPRGEPHDQTRPQEGEPRDQNATQEGEPRDRTESQEGDEPPMAEEVDDQLDQLAMAETADDWAATVQENFHMGQRAPAPQLALMTGRILVGHLDAALTTPAALAADYLSKGTMTSHRAAIKLAEEIPVALLALPVGKALCLHYNHVAKLRHWKPQTLAKNLASLAGALKILPLYRNASGLQIMEDPEFACALRAAQKRARETDIRCPKAATFSEIRQAIRMEGSLPIRVAMALSWCACSRVGDTLKLMTADVTINKEAQTMRLTWRRGKTVGRTQPFTIATKIPQEWADMIERWAATRRTWMFPRTTTTKHVCDALRNANPRLECRSIRRGAIQALAASGATTRTMMLLSGHASEKTLLRYLQWGQCGLNRLEEMTTAATALFTATDATG